MLCIKRKRNLTVTRSRGHASAAAEAIKRRALTVARPREAAARTRLGRDAMFFCPASVSRRRSTRQRERSRARSARRTWGRWKVETQTLTPIDLW